MPRRTAEANRAIQLAWQREYELIQEGKGTRDWTEEQQRDILDPDKGKAYDEDGKAFEGHHMKSAEAYPEYQGNSENIQFLSRVEHTQAHGGWRKPTNGYYDYITGITYDFGENGFAPCKVIALSNPVIVIDPILVDSKVKRLEQIEKEQGSDTDSPLTDPAKSSITMTTAPRDSSAHKTKKKVAVPKVTNENALKRFANRSGKIARKVGKFAIEHKKEIVGIVFTVGSTIWTVVSSSDGNSSMNSDSDENRRYCSSTDDVYNHSETPSNVERSLTCEHEVSRHLQRYHTKEGVVVREKEPYHRGGKKEAH